MRRRAYPGGRSRHRPGRRQPARQPLLERFEPTEEMLALVAQRDAARAAKDFATSDRLRERLQAMGLEVMDSAEGTKIRPRI